MRRRCKGRKNGKWPLCKIIRRRHPTLKRKKNNDNNTGNKKIKNEKIGEKIIK